MKSLWLKLLGLSKAIWEVLWPLAKGKLGEFLADPEVQAIAKDAVLEAAKMATGNATKGVAALDQAKKDISAIGKNYFESWVSIAVESAFQKAKAEGEVH